VVKACHEDLGTISSFPMFANPHVTFTMFSLCFAQRFSYLLHTMFPSLGIFQHYVEFNIHTITRLEKLLGAGSFGGYINHLVCHQATALTFSGKFNFLSIVWIIALTFLECWAFNDLALVTHFQQDNHLILFDAITHVETDIFPFQIAL
jgi:hypothetical protein